MASTLEGLRESLARMPLGQKVRLGAGLLATAGLIWGLSLWATRVRYGVLFSGLRVEDAAPIVEALDGRHVPYRLASGGTSISVPAERVDQLRLELAGEGLPRGGGVGFEIFDKPSFGLSDFVQNVNYRRALERELARTIQGLDVVDSARVHLALPPKALFADERREPSASVVVRLKSQRSLSSNQVRAIGHLVASGVEGLDPARVSVIDGTGRMLSDGTAEQAEAGLSAAQVEAKRSLESNLESTLVALLEPLVGAGHVRARASVELNLARVERVEESYDPDSSVVRSEQKSKSRQTQSSASQGGIPGTASNLPPVEPPAPSAPDTRLNESQSSTLNYEINKVVATIAEPAGTLARQSVAVVVDHATEQASGADGNVTSRRVPRSDEEMRKITDLVRAAAGINVERGDTLIVENVPFDPATAAAIAGSAEDAPGLGLSLWLPTIARYAAPLLAVLLVILLVVRPGLAALRSLRAQAAPAGALPPTVAQLQAALATEPRAEDPAASLRRRLIEAARDNPEAAALVVRGWLSGQE
jgi:flagellar M-ring protein FliF